MNKHLKRLLSGGGLLVVLLGAGVAMQRETQTDNSFAPLGNAAACEVYNGLPEGFGTVPTAGMVRIPSGKFTPGSTHGYPDERPAGSVQVEPFWMDRTEVTHSQFAQFVQATGYRTEAEREGGAAVFRAPNSNDGAMQPRLWTFVKGANWRQPEGSAGTLLGRNHEPVVAVTRSDAQAYARWLGAELPTEAQWEWAARAGGRAEEIEREPRSSSGQPVANYWQGIFPYLDAREDGYAGRAPVGCFPANGFGVHDLIGNVWEWTKDPYQGQHQAHDNGDPAGDTRVMRAALEPGQPYVIKGGSFLCAANYCVRYRAAARHPQENNLATSHVGFRTVRPAF